MAAPFVPTALSTPVVNPAMGSTGAPPVSYVSLSEYNFAPTGMTGRTLVPGNTTTANNQALADVIRRASSWADEICFGLDAATKGASLAASLSVETGYLPIVNGELRLPCDYKPIVELVGLAVGSNPSAVATAPATMTSAVRFGRRTIYVPYTAGSVFRSGDQPGYIPTLNTAGRKVYCVWSYVNGYPHTKLAQNVAAGATTCYVTSTDGNGGLFGVFAATGAFPGTNLLVTDGRYTESVFVKAVTANGATTKLTTSAFSHAHTVPTTPDFIPVGALPDAIHQAVILLATSLIKVRGIRAFVMASSPGQHPTQDVLGQAGAANDYQLACDMLHTYGVRMKLARN